MTNPVISDDEPQVLQPTDMGTLNGEIERLIKLANDEIAREQNVHPDDPLYSIVALNARITEAHTRIWNKQLLDGLVMIQREFQKQQDGIQRFYQQLAETNQQKASDIVTLAASEYGNNLADKVAKQLAEAEQKIAEQTKNSLNQLQQTSIMARVSGYAIAIAASIALGMMLGTLILPLLKH